MDKRLADVTLKSKVERKERVLDKKQSISSHPTLTALNSAAFH